MLRFANIIGPGIRTALTDYFTLPVVPVLFGYDARLQFVHEDDAVEAMRLADPRGRRSGVVNIAGDGVITAKQAVRLVGRPTIPVPLSSSGWIGQLVRRSGLADFSPRPDDVPRLRPRAGHDADALGAGAGAAVHDPRGLRRLRRGCTAADRAAPAYARWSGAH